MLRLAYPGHAARSEFLVDFAAQRGRSGARVEHGLAFAAEGGEPSRVIQAHRADSWRRVFEACPETLFVVAAGNANRDVMEYGDVPASLELPNVLVVGAVDRWGNWATFAFSSFDRTGRWSRALRAATA